MEKLTSEVDDLKNNSDKLLKENVEGVIQKFHYYSQLIAQQKAEVEQIKFLANGYSECLESVSKCITESDGILVESIPLATLPNLVEEHLNTLEVLFSLLIPLNVCTLTLQDIERQLKDKLALKDKLIEDYSSIASMKNTVNPELLDGPMQDISQTWEAVQKQVTINLIIFIKLFVF